MLGVVWKQTAMEEEKNKVSIIREEKTTDSNLYLSPLEPAYNDVSKSERIMFTPSQLTYLHVSKLVGIKDPAESFFVFGASLMDFFNVMQSEVSRKIIYLTLQASRIYNGLAKKTLRIQDIQYERCAEKLLKLSILEPARVGNTEHDPFTRWIKSNTPNIPLKKLKLCKLSAKYRSLFTKIEQDLAQSLEKDVVDEIKHYRFAIKRTHRDIKREKKIKSLQQKKLAIESKKDIYSKVAGNCGVCKAVLIERLPSKENNETITNFRQVKNEFYCNKCYKTLTLGEKHGSH